MTIQTSVNVKLHAYSLSSSLYYRTQSLKFCYTLKENITKVPLSVLTRGYAVCVQIYNAITEIMYLLGHTICQIKVRPTRCNK